MIRTKYVVGEDIHKGRFVQAGAKAICRYSGLVGTVKVKRNFLVDVGTIQGIESRKEFEVVPYLKKKHYEQIAFEVGLLPFLKEVLQVFKKHFMGKYNLVNKENLLLTVETKKFIMSEDNLTEEGLKELYESNEV